MIELHELGKRICIIGPSSSGKSTLAKRLSLKLNLKVCYLDQLAHIPNTNWKPRSKELLKIDHKNFINENDQWIIEGNYSFLMEDRFANATTTIWLDFKILGSIFRYIKRTTNKSNNRAGNLEGAPKQFNLKLINHIIFHAPKKRNKYKKLIEESKTNLVYIDSFTELKKYYKKWEI